MQLDDLHEEIKIELDLMSALDMLFIMAMAFN